MNPLGALGWSAGKRRGTQWRHAEPQQNDVNGYCVPFLNMACSVCESTRDSVNLAGVRRCRNHMGCGVSTAEDDPPVSDAKILSLYEDLHRDRLSSCASADEPSRISRSLDLALKSFAARRSLSNSTEAEPLKEKSSELSRSAVESITQWLDAVATAKPDAINEDRQTDGFSIAHSWSATEIQRTPSTSGLSWSNDTALRREQVSAVPRCSPAQR